MTEFSPGDMVEIETEGGLAYVLVTHEHPSYPPVIRALKGRHGSRPDDLEALAQGDTLFTAMIPLEAALRRLERGHEVAGKVDISAMAADFPVFRMPIRDKRGEIIYWWFWDGRTLSYEVDPDAEKDALPLREIMSAERFAELLDGGA